MTLSLPVLQTERKVLSASQVSTFRECERKWGFVYLEGKRPPPAASAELGTKIHAELEGWLKHAKAPTHPVAVAGMHHAPAPSVPWVEHEFALELSSGPFKGFVDVLYDLQAGTAVTPFTGDVTVIHDWKTSSDPRKWGKTQEQLRTDVQANLYAGWAFRKGAKAVHGHWVYLPTRGLAVAHPVRIVFDRASVEDQLSAIDCSANAIQSLYRIRPKTSALKANTSACGSYGGCPHAAYCSRPLEDLFGGVTVSTDYSSFLSDVDNRLGVTAPPAPVAPPPPPVLAPPPPPVLAPPPVVLPPIQGAAGAPHRPAYWMPGDPMNETQQYLQGRNAKMSVIANCADVPPPPEVAQTYDLAPAPVALPAPVLERPPINPLDQINPPERPAVAPIVVEELPRAPEAVRATAPAQDDLDALDRDALKAMGVQMGIFGAGERRQAPGLRTAIREARKAVQAAGQKADSFAEVQAVRPPPSPVFVPPAAQAEFEAKMAAPTQAEIAASMRDGSAKFVSPPPVVTPEQAVEAIAASLPQPSLGPDYTMDDSRFQDGHAEGYAKAKADTALNLETFVSTLTPAQLGKLLKLAAKALGAQVVLSYGDDK